MTRDRHGRATLARRGSALAVSTLVVRTSVTAIWASVGIMVARTLGVHGRGQAAFVSSIYFVGLLALNLGYENAILNRRAELHTPPADLRRLGGFVALVAGLTGVAMVVAAKRLDPGGAFSDVRLVWLLAGVGPLPLALDLVYLRALFQTVGRLDLVNATMLVGALAQFTVVLVAVVRGQLTVGLAVGAASLGVVAPWIALRIRAASFGRARLQPNMVRPALAFGLKSSLGITFLYLMYRIDFVVVKGMLGATMLGLYAVSTSVAELLWLVTDSVALALVAPQVTEAAVDALALTATALRRMAVALPPAAAVLGAAGAWAIPLVFGERFRPAVTPMLVLIPGVLAIGAIKPVSLLVVRSGPWTITLISFSGLVVNLALLIPMAAAWGIVGAAAASTIAYATIAVLYVWWLRIAGLTWRDLRPKVADLRAVATLMTPRGATSLLRGALNGPPPPASSDDAGAWREQSAA